MRRVEHLERHPVEAPRTSGARLEPPMPQTTTRLSFRPSSSASSSGIRWRIRSGSSSQPSQCASSRPVQTVGSRSQIRSKTSAGSSSRRGELSLLRANAVERLGERVGELLDSLALERVRDVVVVDACFGEARGRPPPPRRRPPSGSRLPRPWSWKARIVSSGIVFTVSGPISVLDVEDVGVRRVLRRGRGPEAPLLRRAGLLEHLPARAGEHLLPVAVRELRVRHRELALQRRRGRRSRRAACRPRCRRGRRSSSRRSSRGEVAARRAEPLEPADVRLHHLAVTFSEKMSVTLIEWPAAIMSSIDGRPPSSPGS